MTIQVFTGVDRPVVVKTATTAASRDALQRESRRLQQARHPGVVEVASFSADRLEIAWVGVHTLETAKLAVPAAAAVLAAVAQTVADLHAMGIVHGRLDPSHVVLTGDGRPVLCGMVGPDPTDVTTGPADDVGALGHLINHLVGPEAEPEPIPERRWSRRNWSGYNRRALQTLADRAAHDDPARRPTARALANAIVETVPEARLLPPPAGTPDRPDLSAHDDTAAEVGVVADTDGDVAVAVGVGVGGDEGADLDGPLEQETVEPEAAVAPVRAETTDDDEADEFDEADDDDALATVDGRPYLDVDDLPPLTERDLHPADLDATGPPKAPTPPEPPAEDYSVAASRPVADAPPSQRRGGVLVGTAAVAVILAAVYVTTLPPDDRANPPASVAHRSSTHAVDTPDTTGTAATSEPNTDLEVTRVVDAGTTYAVGEPGDVVEVADWDCDGMETPGVVRPATGEVFIFDRWATVDEPVVNTPALIVAGAGSLVPPTAGGPCAVGLLLDDGQTLRLVGERADATVPTSWTVEEVQA